MVVHWWRERGRGWQLKAVANGLGTLVTALTLIVVAFAKFRDGAWIIILLIPLIVFAFLSIRRHYDDVRSELTLRGLPPSLKPYPKPRLVLPVSNVHRGVIEAARYARSISDQVTAVYVEINPGAAEKIRREWTQWEPDVPLIVIPSPYRSTVGPLLEYLDRSDREHNDGQLTSVLLPEFIPIKWWQNLLHNQTAALIRLALIYQRRRGGQTRAIIDVPFYLKR